MSFLIDAVKKVVPSPKGKKREKMQVAFMRFCRIFPINKKKVVFSSFVGMRFDDNPRAIYMEMVRRHPDWDYVWILPDDKIKLRCAKIVRPNSFDSIFHLATAKIWIDNCRKDHWLEKRKGQYYVQTWHGDIALKKVEKDTQDTLSADYIRRCINDSKMADLFITGCKWRAENYRKAFWYNGKILMLGMPKSDIYYKDSRPYKQKVCRYFGLPFGTKLCVYVPTFRNNGNVSCYDIDYRRMKTALEDKWGGSWKILVRLHPNVQGMQTAIEYDDDILNATPYKETNELIAVADMVITDYSSCMFDALEAGKRVLLYASDMKSYLKEREFYFRLDELPFMLSENNDELITNVMSFDDKVYSEKISAFRQRLGFCNGSDSTEKVTQYILKMTEGRN